MYVTMFYYTFTFTQWENMFKTEFSVNIIYNSVLHYLIKYCYWWKWKFYVCVYWLLILMYWYWGMRLLDKFSEINNLNWKEKNIKCYDGNKFLLLKTCSLM